VSAFRIQGGLVSALTPFAAEWGKAAINDMTVNWQIHERIMTGSRIQRMEALVRELSIQDDPDQLIRAFSRQADLLIPRDGVISVSRRDLEPYSYRITRSWRWREEINPWTEIHRLPMLEGGLLGRLLYEGKPVIFNRLEVPADDPAAEHLQGMRSLASAPGYDQGKPLNMVTLLRREPDSFVMEELETLLLHANLLGRAVNNLLLNQQLQETYRNLDNEKAQVGRMQRHLLPTTLPQIDGLELAAVYRTCSRAGGDYYDVLPLPDEQWGLFVADVSGHGTPAAVVMAMMHTLIHAFPGPVMPAAHVLSHINRHLLAVAPEGMFATAFYGIYDPYYRRLRYASAGHPAPLLRRRSGIIQGLEGTAGMPLGVVDEDSWAEHEVNLVPGETLLLYTDGILEGMNEAGEAFGRQRLDHALELGPMRALPLVEHLERHYRDFCNGLPDMDDRTLLAAVAVP
jgi:phosphoserine phosphatase RsbU/P